MKTDTTPYKFSMSYVMEDHAAARRRRSEAAETEVDRPRLCLARQADKGDAWGPGQTHEMQVTEAIDRTNLGVGNDLGTDDLATVPGF